MFPFPSVLFWHKFDVTHLQLPTSGQMPYWHTLGPSGIYVFYLVVHFCKVKTSEANSKWKDKCYNLIFMRFICINWL